MSREELVAGSGRGTRTEAALAGKPLAEAAGSSRRAALARGAALAAGAALALIRPASAAAQASDVDQLERLLALEQRLQSLYETALARDAVETETVGAYQEALTALRSTRLLLPLGSIMASGAQHVVALRQASGDELLAPA